MVSKRTATVLIGLLVATLGACAEGAGGTSEGAAELIGTVWRWTEFQDSADGAEANDMRVSESEKYTLTLNPDGTAHLRVDCNRARLQYTLEGSRLAFDTTWPMTRAYCGEKSLSDRYLERLVNTVTYVLTGDTLHLNLKLDPGNMVFVAE